MDSAIRPRVSLAGAAAALLLGMACDPTSTLDRPPTTAPDSAPTTAPDPPIQRSSETFVLRTYGFNTVPTIVSIINYDEYWVLADTLILWSDGTGSQTQWNAQRNRLTGVADTTRRVRQLRHRRSATDLTVDLVSCDWPCVNPTGSRRYLIAGDTLSTAIGDWPAVFRYVRTPAAPRP